MFAFEYQSYGDVERELQEMATEHGTSANELVELVRINEETMEMMRVSVSCTYSTTPRNSSKPGK